MKEVKIKGGLGNQLFQYAFAKKLEIETNELIGLDISIYDTFKERSLEITKFNLKIKNNLQHRVMKRLKFGTFLYKIYVLLNIVFNIKYYFEKKEKVEKIEKLKEYNYFDGYWQDLYYLSGIEEELRKELKLINNIEYKIKKNAVAVGFRKGDYLKQNIKKKFGICDLYYYKTGVKIIKDKISNPIFYIFSDDICLVKKDIKKIFSEEDNIVYINEDKKYSPAEELIIMSKCQHAIIPNSTFSWWGAWLMENPFKIIIVPKYWYKDGSNINIIPKEWIKIKNKDEI